MFPFLFSRTPQARPPLYCRIPKRQAIRILPANASFDNILDENNMNSYSADGCTLL